MSFIYDANHEKGHSCRNSRNGCKRKESYRLESFYFTGTMQGHNYQEFTLGVAFRLVAYALSQKDSLIYYRDA